MKKLRTRCQKIVLIILGIKPNNYHPFVWILGNPLIGKGVYIGGFSEINANKSVITIGDFCDIASFVSINCADSHAFTLGYDTEISRKEIHIGSRVFIGSHVVIKGGARIGDRTVIAAGTVVDACEIPPNSLVFGNPMQIKPGYYGKYFSGNPT
jgi:acetyltransferase-like isoleucine patch superfamily enzyme